MNSAPVFTLDQGTAPLLVSLPHVGTEIPVDLRADFESFALDVEDTDWRCDQLYGFVRGLGASLITPRLSRYLIDLNRPPDNAPMYAGSHNTELCPTRAFSGKALYLPDKEPSLGEVHRRRQACWQPYHDALAAELNRLRDMHGHAILFDGHSIRSHLPWLFDGRLPDLNLGTAGGTSCAPTLRRALVDVVESQSRFTNAVDGRFKGGYITRHHGRPTEGWHAVQLEMAWSTYMVEVPPYVVDPTRAAALEPVLRALVRTMLDWKPA